MKRDKFTKIRCFVCIEPDDLVLHRLRQWLEFLKVKAPRLKWVRPEALHLTLRFCGELDIPVVQRLRRILSSELEGLGGFSLGLAGTGVFPPQGPPRVLWAGVTGDRVALKRLYGKVEKASVACGLSPERRSFSPHLTLARVRLAADLPPSLLPFEAVGGSDWGKWTVQEVTLMRSELGRYGPRYSPIEQFSLR